MCTQGVGDEVKSEISVFPLASPLLCALCVLCG